MATPTNVQVRKDSRSQFQGLFENVWVVKATIDVGSLGSNAAESSTITVSGLDPAKDHVLSLQRTTPAADPRLFEVAHVSTDSIHVVAHNASGGVLDPASSEYTIVVGRLVQ